MSFDIAQLTTAIARHGRVARVVVAAVKGSAPREVGASMLVWDGGQSGTIGGGALEFDAAANAFSGAKVETIALGPARGQCCGGAVTLVTEIFDSAPSVTDYFSRAINELHSMPLSIRRQKAISRRGEPTQLIYENGWLGEPIARVKTPLWIYGAGHVGRALVSVFQPLPDYEITWIDTAQSRFPDLIPDGVADLVATNPAHAVRHAPVNACHLVLTYSHSFDLEICHQLLGHGFSSAGLIGSQTKWARFHSRLKSLGHSEQQISRIECPIGDPSLGKHPQEIAVGVASRLLSRRRVSSVGKDCAN